MLSRTAKIFRHSRRVCNKSALSCVATSSSSSAMLGMKKNIPTTTFQNQFLVENIKNFSTQLNVRNQQQEQPLDESALSQHIFQFIQQQSANLPLQNFADLDKLLQTLIFQGHLIFRAQTMEEWKPVYYEILNILSSNSTIFADIDQTQLSQVEKDVNEFADAIISTFEKYATSGGLENKVVGDVLR